MKYLLGIDVGTTGTKALLFREDGKLMGQAYEGYSIHTPNPGYCEQTPEDWWNALCHTVRQVCADPQIRRKIAALCLSTQGGTTLCVDANGKVLRPAIVWNDQRCGEELKNLRQELPNLNVYRTCGWYAAAAMPALQCRWLAKHEPEIFRQTAAFLSVPDYLSLRLTGKAVIDPSNAGICRFLNVRTGRYDADILGYASLREEQLPTLLPSGAPVGTLTEEAANALDLPQNTVLVSGAHDQYAVSLGAGMFCKGDLLIGSGTSWVITSLSDSPEFDTGLSQSVSAVPGMWGSLRSLSSGGVCLEWLRKNISSAADGTLPDYDTINHEVSTRRAALDGLFFFPFSGRSGEKSLFRKATLTGMDLSHDKFHIARAIMEGVAFQTRWMAESFSAKPGEDGIILAGGAAKSRVWTQILADITGLPVKVPENPELACIGAAVLAGVGCGLYSDVQTGYEKLAVRNRTVMPDPDLHAQYEKAYQQYKASAASLAEMYRGNQE